MVTKTIKTILHSTVRIKMTLRLMCCYKLERSAKEEAQQSSSAKRNLQHEFLRLPVIQTFRKPAQNHWFIDELPVLLNNVLKKEILHLFQTLSHLNQYSCCYETLFAMCNLTIFFACDLFIVQNLILLYLLSQRIFSGVHEHFLDNRVFVFQH